MIETRSLFLIKKAFCYLKSGIKGTENYSSFVHFLIIYFQLVFAQLFWGYPYCLFSRVLLTDRAQTLSLDSQLCTFMSGKSARKQRR